MTTPFRHFLHFARVLSSALALLVPYAAHAQAPSVPHPHAYGIIVGNNNGEAGQQPLRYAEDDASRMAEVLREVGRLVWTSTSGRGGRCEPALVGAAESDESGKLALTTRLRAGDSIVTASPRH